MPPERDQRQFNRAVCCQLQGFVRRQAIWRGSCVKQVGASQGIGPEQKIRPLRSGLRSRFRIGARFLVSESWRIVESKDFQIPDVGQIAMGQPRV